MCRNRIPFPPSYFVVLSMWGVSREVMRLHNAYFHFGTWLGSCVVLCMVKLGLGICLFDDWYVQCTLCLKVHNLWKGMGVLIKHIPIIRNPITNTTVSTLGLWSQCYLYIYYLNSQIITLLRCKWCGTDARCQKIPNSNITDSSYKHDHERLACSFGNEFEKLNHQLNWFESIQLSHF